MADLTDAMLAMLRNADRGADLFNGLVGRSSRGGANRTRIALNKRGLLDDWEITDAGRAALKHTEAQPNA